MPVKQTQFTKTILRCPSLPLGAPTAGVWMDMSRVCGSAYPLNIYSGIQTKKVRQLHFSLFSASLHNSSTVSRDVIFLITYHKCAISQLSNTLHKSVKCFYVYSICLAQYYSTFPSVLEMRKCGRNGEQKQSS